MYVYTHAVTGAALGSLVKNDKRYILLGMVSAILPDLPMGVQIVYTLLEGHNAWDIQWSKPIVTASDALHSLPICALLLTAGWKKLEIRTVALCLLSHCLLDVTSHEVTPEFKASYMWPFQWQLGNWLSVWDYRRGPGKLLPKWPEIALNLAAGALLVSRLLRKR